ncbi:MAG: DUF262 domain-containing protein [Candidatus Poribacteria bacterium]|nr:DUF262 domain-containing protein [Candidatus Poribacteria bacterium]
MKIEQLDLTVREIVEDYDDAGEGGVTGYGGKLDIRPPFQREFIYNDKERNAVIDSILKGFPLNVMYWSDRENGEFEIIDGQQRTISVAQYVDGDFSIEGKYFHNLPSDKQELILDYKLMVYACSGADSEKLEWFKTINIAGKELTTQELRNAVYAGTWLSDAKRYFSRNGCVAYQIGNAYVKGRPIRQEYLETVIKWVSKGSIEDYMGTHQHDEDALLLWEYFQSVIDWVESTFTNTRPKIMRGVDWGSLHNHFGDADLNAEKIEQETARLILDDDVTRKAGIYSYILTGEEKHLNIRAFSDSMKQKVYETQSGICVRCDDKFTIKEMEADHITPWSEDGKTTEDNCQMLCKKCNREKSAR